jgi:hypothetical protein
MANLVLYDEIIASNTVDKVLVYDYSLYKAIKSKNPTQIIEFTGSSFKSYLSAVYGFFLYIKWGLSSYFSRSLKRVKELQKKKSIVFLDTFIFKKTDRYWDRYYPSLLNYLDSESKDKVYFLAFCQTEIGKRNKDEIIRNSKENIAYWTDFLKLDDYIYAIRVVFHKWWNTLQLEYRGYDLHEVFVNAQLRNIQPHFFFAPLYIRAIKNMKEYNIQIEKMVDWYENQSCDKALYYGMEKYYPSTPVCGYVGFIYDENTFIHPVPSVLEQENSFAPKKIFVCSKLLKHRFETSGYKGEISLIGALRNQDVYSTIISHVCKERVIILCPLALDVEELDFKYHYFKELSQRYSSFSNVLVLIKPHPALMTEAYNDVRYKNIEIKIVNNNLYELFQDADIVIGANTSAMFEAMALGIPVIQLANERSLDKQPEKSGCLWSRCNSIDVFEYTMHQVLNTPKEELKQQSLHFRDYYFEKCNIENVSQLVKQK